MNRKQQHILVLAGKKKEVIMPIFYDEGLVFYVLNTKTRMHLKFGFMDYYKRVWQASADASDHEMTMNVYRSFSNQCFNYQLALI